MLGTFLCFSPDQMYLYGHYNSDSARMLYIYVKKCVEKTHCADEATIQNYFAGTYVNLMSNRSRFDFRQFGPDSIIKESSLEWTALQTQIQIEMPLRVT